MIQKTLKTGGNVNWACITLLVLGLPLFTGTVRAQQDAIYSQYMFNEAVVNPAAAGTGGGVRAVLLYKRQWVSLPGAPRGQSFSLDGPLTTSFLKDKLGAGLHFTSDRFGPNSNSGILASVSYKMNVGKKILSLGLRGGVKGYSINWGDIQYASGYKAGDDYRHGAAVPQLGIGARYYSKKFHVGLLLDNLVQPDIDIQRPDIGTYGRLYRSFQITSGYDFHVNDWLNIQTSLLIKRASTAPQDLMLNANFVLFKDFWLGMGLTGQAGGNILVGARIGENFMVGYAFKGSVSEVQDAGGASHEILIAYAVKQKEPDIKLHFMSEAGEIIKIAQRSKDGYFYFDKLPEQSSYLFQLASDDEALLSLMKEVEIRFKNTKGEEVTVNLKKDKDEFFRYNYLPSLEEDKLYAINPAHDTVGVAKMNAEGYFVFEYLPNDQNLIFIKSDTVNETEMVMSVLINDKITEIKKGQDQYFRFVALAPEVVTLYLLGANGDTLASGGLNADGFFVFEKLPIDQNYLFFLDARDVDLIDEVQIIQKKGQGGKKVLTLTKGEGKFFKYEYLEHQEARLYLIGEKGDTLMSTLRNTDGFFVFEKLPVGQSYLFMLDGEETALIDDILVLTKDKKGEEVVLTAAKQKENLFRYDALPSNTVSIPGMLAEDEVAFILNNQDERILRTAYESLKFNTGEAIIRLESYPYLEALGKMLELNPDWIIVLSGFTDDVGSDSYNLLLSKQRAETVKRAFVKRNVPPSQIRVKFYGETHPIASNKTEEGRQKNRRVEMRIVKLK